MCPKELFETLDASYKDQLAHIQGMRDRGNIFKLEKPLF
jgi:hypothetical protein